MLSFSQKLRMVFMVPTIVMPQYLRERERTPDEWAFKLDFLGLAKHWRYHPTMVYSQLKLGLWKWRMIYNVKKQWQQKIFYVKEVYIQLASGTNQYSTLNGGNTWTASNRCEHGCHFLNTHMHGKPQLKLIICTIIWRGAASALNWVNPAKWEKSRKLHYLRFLHRCCVLVTHWADFHPSLPFFVSLLEKLFHDSVCPLPIEFQGFGGIT